MGGERSVSPADMRFNHSRDHPGVSDSVNTDCELKQYDTLMNDMRCGFSAALFIITGLWGAVCQWHTFSTDRSGYGDAAHEAIRGYHRMSKQKDKTYIGGDP